jgi:hypothetical protein
MTWFEWYVAVGIPLELIALAFALDWWAGREVRRK